MANVCASFKFIKDSAMSKRFSATRYEIHMKRCDVFHAQPVRLWWVDIIVSHRIIPHRFSFSQTQKKISSFSNEQQNNNKSDVYINGLENPKEKKQQREINHVEASLRWANSDFHRKHMDYVWSIHCSLLSNWLTSELFAISHNDRDVTWCTATETPIEIVIHFCYISICTSFCWEKFSTHRYEIHLITT